MVIGRVYIILHKLDMTKGDMDVFGLQNVILPGFNSIPWHHKLNCTYLSGCQRNEGVSIPLPWSEEAAPLP